MGFCNVCTFLNVFFVFEGVLKRSGKKINKSLETRPTWQITEAAEELLSTGQLVIIFVGRHVLTMRNAAFGFRHSLVK